MLPALAGAIRTADGWVRITDHRIALPTLAGAMRTGRFDTAALQRAMLPTLAGAMMTPIRTSRKRSPRSCCQPSQGR